MRCSGNGVIQVGMGDSEFWKLSGVSDDHLLHELKRAIASGARLDAAIVAHLAEVEERRLHLTAACSSLFEYCLRRLGFSESEAFHRITAARLGRRFPVIFELLAARTIHLSALRVLRDHLTPENHRSLLVAASGKSKKEVELLVATLAPRPSVAPSIRKLPIRGEGPLPPPTDFEARLPSSAVRSDDQASPTRTRHIPITTPALENSKPSTGGTTGTGTTGAALQVASESSGAVPPGLASESNALSARWARLGSNTEVRALASESNPQNLPTLEFDAGVAAPPAPTSNARNSRAARQESYGRSSRVIEPLSGTRYLLRVTVSCEFEEKLARARDLMSHANASGELAAVLERGLDLLLAKLERQRFART